MQVQTTDNFELIYIFDNQEDLAEFQAQQEEKVFQISMHGVLGIGATKNTFTLNVQMGTVQATTLIDSGSTSTFMTAKLAAKIPLQPIPSTKLKVLMAGGGILWSQFTCNSCSYSIQGEPFRDDFKVLRLKCYDTILGADWLRTYIHVELDYQNMIMRIKNS